MDEEDNILDYGDMADEEMEDNEFVPVTQDELQQSPVQDYDDMAQNGRMDSNQQEETQTADAKPAQEQPGFFAKVKEEFQKRMEEQDIDDSVNFFQRPFQWFKISLQKLLIGAAVLAGQVVRGFITGDPNPLNYKSMMEKTDEKKTLKDAVKGKGQEESAEQKGEQSEDKKEQEKSEKTKDFSEVQDELQKTDQKSSEKVRQSVEKTNVFLKTVGLSALYDTENKTLNLFMNNERLQLNITRFDEALHLAMEQEGEKSWGKVGKEIATRVQEALDLHDNQSNLPTEKNALRGILCAASLIGNQLDIDNSNPLKDPVHHQLAECSLASGKKIEIMADTVYDSSGQQPTASISLSCLYDGKVFAKMPFALLNSEQDLNPQIFEKLSEALLQNIANPEQNNILDLSNELHTPPQRENVSEETRFMDNLFQQYNQQGENDIKIQQVSEEMKGQNISCVGQIKDISVFQTKKGKDMCVFQLQDATGTIKCVCPPKQYNELKNMIQDSPDTVRISGEVNLNSYKNQNTIEIKAEAIQTVELMHEQTAGMNGPDKDETEAMFNQGTDMYMEGMESEGLSPDEELEKMAAAAMDQQVQAAEDQDLELCQ